MVAAASNGTYQMSLYDTLAFASGGNIVISGGDVTAINGTYTNWDKLDGSDPACTLIFQWGQGLSPTPVEDFADGVEFADSYASTGGGVLTWTVEFVPGEGSTLEGTVTAVGSDFTGIDQGCNGNFPPLTLTAGKSTNCNHDTFIGAAHPSGPFLVASVESVEPRILAQTGSKIEEPRTKTPSTRNAVVCEPFTVSGPRPALEPSCGEGIWPAF